MNEMNEMDFEEDYENYVCLGCGIQIQFDEPSIAGYAPLSAVTREPVTCQRCFRIKHYNEVSKSNVSNDSFLKLLDSIGKTRALVLWVLDLFDLEGSMLSGLRRFIGTNPVIVAVNKIDLFDRSTNRSRVQHAIYRRLKEEGVNVQEVVLMSALSGQGLEPLVEALTKFRAGKKTYVIGATNVGKSSLINRLIREYSDLEHELTVSRFPGTTLDAVHIPLTDGGELIDTPGIVNSFRLTEMVDPSDLKVIVPDRTLKPRVFQLNPEQTLFFGAFVRIDFVSGGRQSFTCYVSNDLDIHRSKLERADLMSENHRGTLLAPPTLETIEANPTRWAWKRQSLRIAPGKSYDIVVAGLGWIRVNETTGATIDVYAPAETKVILREAIISKPPVLEKPVVSKRPASPGSKPFFRGTGKPSANGKPSASGKPNAYGKGAYGRGKPTGPSGPKSTPPKRGGNQP